MTTSTSTDVNAGRTSTTPFVHDLPADFVTILQPPDHFGITHLFTLPTMKVSDFYSKETSTTTFCTDLLQHGICRDLECKHHHHPYYFCKLSNETQKDVNILTLQDAFDLTKNQVWKKNIDFQLWLIASYFSDVFSSQVRAVSRNVYMYLLQNLHLIFYDSFGYDLLENDEPSAELLALHPLAKEHFCIYERNQICKLPLHECRGSHDPAQLFIDVCYAICEHKDGKSSKEIHDLRKEEIVKTHKDIHKDKFKGESVVLWSRFQYKLWLLKYFPLYQQSNPQPSFFALLAFVYRKFIQGKDKSNQDVRELELIQHRVGKYHEVLQKKIDKHFEEKVKEEERRVQEQHRQQADLKKQHILKAVTENYVVRIQQMIDDKEFHELQRLCIEHLDAIVTNLNIYRKHCGAVPPSDLTNMVLLVNKTRSADFIKAIKEQFSVLLQSQPIAQQHKAIKEFEGYCDLILGKMKTYLEFVKRFKLIREKDKNKIPNRIQETMDEYQCICQRFDVNSEMVTSNHVAIWLSKQLQEIKLQNQVQKKEVEAADNLLDDCFTEDIASLRILNEVTQVNTSPPPGLPSPPAKRAQPENCSLHANILADSNSASADRISSSLNISAKRRIVSVDDLISEEHYPPSWDIIEEEKITSDNSTKIESPFLSSFPSIPSPFSTIDLANTGDALDNNSTSISHLINGYPLVNSIMEDSGVDIGLGMGIDMNRLSKSNIAGSRAGTSQFSLLDTFWNVDSALSSGNNYLATARVGSPTNASITSNATTTTSSTSVLYQHSSLMFSLEQYVQRLNELHDDLSPVDIGCPKEVFKELYFYCNTCNTHLDLKSYKLHRLNRRLKSHAISTFCSECVEYRDNFLFCPSCVNVEDRIPVACTECMPTLHDENIDVLYSGHAYDFEHPICFPCIEK